MLKIGEAVTSRPEIIEGINMTSYPDNPHIGIAASITGDGLRSNDNIADYFRAIGFNEAAIWQPHSIIAGSSLVARTVDIAATAYLDHGLLPDGKTHDIYGEILSFDCLTSTEKIEALDEENEYDDRKPHIDFVPAETTCAVMLGSNTGGTVAWEGTYQYRGNLESSYEDVIGGMSKVDTSPGRFLFSTDARTLLHARGENVTNVSRILARIFIGPRP